MTAPDHTYTDKRTDANFTDQNSIGKF